MLDPSGERKTDPQEGAGPGGEGAPREHRYAFARRWERKKQSRNTRKTWGLLVLDLGLLLLIALMATILVNKLGD